MLDTMHFMFDPFPRHLHPDSEIAIAAAFVHAVRLGCAEIRIYVYDGTWRAIRT